MDEISDEGSTGIDQDMSLLNLTGNQNRMEHSGKWQPELASARAENVTRGQSGAPQENSATPEFEPALGAFRKVFEDSVRAMGQMIEVRDPYTAGHQKRVARISIEIAQAMQLPARQIKGIQLAALIHDIGKLAVPSEILSKPGRLSEAEFDMIKTHSRVGFSILKDIEFPWPIARIVLQHHERINGSGYPDGLQGEEILLETRIISVADVIEAMSSSRPYRAARGADLALEEIERHKGILYDTEVADACLTHFRLRGFQI